MLDLDDLILIVLLAVGVSCGIGATTTFALQAPEGYEDDSGFHFS
jgi:hypothetical protein